MKSYDLYGFKSPNFETVRTAIEQTLAFKFNLHESLYLGGEYYRFGNIGEEEFILLNNYNSTEQDWTEAEFQEMGILLYVGGTKRSEEIKRMLTPKVR